MYKPPHPLAARHIFEKGGYAQPDAYYVVFDLSTGGTGINYLPSPSLVVDTYVPWRPNTPPKELLAIAPFGDAEIKNTTVTLNASQAGTILDYSIAGGFGEAPDKDRDTSVGWDASIGPRDSTVHALHKQATPKDLDNVSGPWEDASVILDGYIASSFQNKATPWKDRTIRSLFYSTDLVGALYRREQNLPAPLAKQNIGFADLGFLRVRSIPRNELLEFAPKRYNNPSQPKDLDYTVPFGDAQYRDILKHIPWGPGGFRDTTLRFVYPDYNGPITPPGTTIPAEEKETYRHMNTVNVKRVSDDAPIEMQNIAITLDVDSWAWRITGTVIGTASLAMITPETGLVDIEVELNGHIWIFMVESYSGSREHANERFTVQGVSRTQLLAAPYALERSAAFTTQIQANQIIDDELFGTGFLVNWNTAASWSVVADAFSFQDLAPIAVAKRIADAAGAILVPSKDTSELTLKPRFRISPWALDAHPLGELDAQIPMAMVSRLSHQYQPAPLYDSVYISGTTTGEATLVELNGTGGLSPAPDVFDDLMTDTDVNIERSRQVIAGSGARGMYSITIAVPEFVEAPGLLEPGMVVSVIEGAVEWRGYVLGTSITAPRSGAEKIEQTVEVVRFYEH